MTEGVTSDTYRELPKSGVQKHNNRMICLLRENGGKLPGVSDDETKYGFFGDYQSRIGRVIPMFGLVAR